MMRMGKTVLAVLMALGMAGCAARDVSRAQTGMDAPLLSAQETRVAEQAAALRDLTDTMLRKATLRGATIGAAVGCGVATVIGDTGCLQAAVIGGAIGGVAGHATARRDIARQIEIVQPGHVLPTMSSARTTLRQIETTLPALIAAQDTEIANMRAALALGTLTQEQHDARLAQIGQSRAALGAALLQAADNTRATRGLLQAAQDQGQDGLDWYLATTDEMERKVISTRSAISLL